MKIASALFALILGLSCLPPTECLGWNFTGHVTSGQLAYRRLSPEVRAVVAELVRQHPHYANLLANDVPPGIDADEWAFMKCAYWPDLVRPASRDYPTFKPRTVTDYHRGPWHYVNVPYYPPSAPTTQPALTPSTVPARSVAATRPATQPVAEYPEPVYDVLSAIDWNTKLLADATKPAADRAVALAWICHLVGDIHQPLHACTLFSDAYPDGDRGGNDQTFRTGGAPINMHAFWDQALGTSDDPTAIMFLADDISRDPRCDVSKVAGYGVRNTAKEWADESHKLAIALVHLQGRLKTVSTREFRDSRMPAEQVPEAPTGYAANAYALSRVRIALAAARLADVIGTAVQPTAAVPMP